MYQSMTSCNTKRARVRLKAIARRGDEDKLRASWASFAGYMKYCQGGAGQAVIFNESASCGRVPSVV